MVRRIYPSHAHFDQLFKSVGTFRRVSRWFNQSLFENLAFAVRTLRWLFQNVIRHARIGAGNAVENDIEGNLRTFGIAVLTGVDEPLGFVQGCSVDEHYVLLFGRWIEEVARHSIVITN
jgi:hypothetical protein